MELLHIFEGRRRKNLLKRPWEMTLEEWKRDPYKGLRPTKPGHILLFHVLNDNSHLESVLETGLDPQKRWGSEGPTTMASADPKGWSKYNTLIGFQAPEDSAVKSGPYYLLYRRIPPEDILFVDPVNDLDIAPIGIRESWLRTNTYAHKYHEAYVIRAARSGIKVAPEVLGDIDPFPEIVDESLADFVLSMCEGAKDRYMQMVPQVLLDIEAPGDIEDSLQNIMEVGRRNEDWIIWLFRWYLYERARNLLEGYE